MAHYSDNDDLHPVDARRARYIAGLVIDHVYTRPIPEIREILDEEMHWGNGWDCPAGMIRAMRPKELRRTYLEFLMGWSASGCIEDEEVEPTIIDCWYEIGFALEAWSEYGVPAPTEGGFRRYLANELKRMLDGGAFEGDAIRVTAARCAAMDIVEYLATAVTR